MDEKQASSSRGTGIPRLSRLPVLRSTPSVSSLKTTPSRESLTSQVPKPRLRTAASRDQLPKATAATTTTAPTARLVPRRSLAGPKPSSTTTQNATSIRKPKPLSRQTSDVDLSRSQAPTPASMTASTSSTSPDLPDISEKIPYEIDGSGYDTLRPRSSKPRPSLSERTMETLAQLPSSPALSKKSSSFFDPDGSRRSRSRAGSNNSRPSSSYTSDGSMRPPSQGRSRPGSSSSGHDDGGMPNFRASTNTFRTPLDTIHGTPSRRTSGIASFKTPGVKATPRTGAPQYSASTISQPPNRTASPAGSSFATPSKTLSKSVSARPLKPRASVQGLFKKPSISNMEKPTTPAAPRTLSKPTLRTPSGPKLAKPGSVPPPIATSEKDDGEPKEAPHVKASAALREQIAKAKAAKKAAAAARQAAEEPSVDEPAPEPSEAPARKRLPPKSPIVPQDDSFDFGLDPFNTKRSEDSTKKILQQRLADARASGRLNIAALGYKSIPPDVLKMYDSESMGTYDGSWAESVDLTRFVAADNEFESIDDSIFPDVPLDELAEDENSAGNIFGGLENLDLHGNLLIEVPMGLRQLPQLTTLNLSSNRLANNCLEPISQITTLRDLKVANNLFYGPLDPCFSNLRNLEILDLHGNNISFLPVNIGNLERLRILNISENSLEVIPFAALAKMPLNELWAQKNQLTGTLIEPGVEVLPKLQTLDISCNQITHIVAPGTTVSMPMLYQFTMTMNRMQELPDVTSWPGLITLNADENSIAGFPEGFLSLEKLRHVDFTSNDIRVVPPEIARMDNLTMIRLSGNPLRDKKFVSITTEELKDALSARLEPPPPYDDVASAVKVAELPEKETEMKPAPIEDQDGDSRSDLDDFATPPTSAPHSPARSRSHTVSSQTWPVKQGGLLDRSNTESSSLHPVVCSKVAAATKVYEVQLHHNLFTALPESLSFFAETLTALSLAHNKLVGETYLSTELELPVLKELNLVNNHITSLAPLTEFLKAPLLEKIDVSMNRITTLPADLRTAYPALVVLLAANNHLEELDPETIKGMQVVDAGYNDITHLNPKIGLLGGNGGLKRLDVNGNRFRVPRFSVLERGTDATLRWLRGRVPVAEMAKWKESHGDMAGGMSDDDDDVD